MSRGGSTGVVMVALVANFGIAVAKFAAAAWTGSSAMLSEAIHSLVDTSNQGLMLYGIKRSQRPADAVHPFGYAKELYFWAFVVAVLLFSLGAGVAIYEGVDKLANPRPITDPIVNYVVIGVAFLLESFSAHRAITEFNARRGNQPIGYALRSSKDPALFTVLLEDIAALIGLTFAFCGIAIAHATGSTAADAYASILIGLLLGAVAAFMSIEIRSLIIGESASPAVRRDIQEAILAEVGPGRPIRAINEIRTTHLGPTDILVVASVDFEDDETAASIEAAVARIEATIRTHTPAVRRIFIEGQSAADHARTEQILAGLPPKTATPFPTKPAADAAPLVEMAPEEKSEAAPVSVQQLAAAPIEAPRPVPPAPAATRTPAPANRESRKGRKRSKHKR